MQKLLKYRIQLVTLFMGAFGGAVAKIFNLYDLGWTFFGFSCILALVINLLMSFMIAGKWNRKIEKQFKVASVILLVCFLGAAALYVSIYLSLTFLYPGEGNPSRLVKGNAYSVLGEKHRQQNPTMSDGEILQKFLGGPPANEKLWDESLSTNSFKLVGSFCLIVIFFSALISVLLEILTVHHGEHLDRSERRDKPVGKPDV